MASELYDGKLFYEVVVDTDRKQVFLSGPYDNIRYTVNDKINNTHHQFSPNYSLLYPFVQIIDGQIVRNFKKDEIVVIDASNNA